MFDTDANNTPVEPSTTGTDVAAEQVAAESSTANEVNEPKNLEEAIFPVEGEGEASESVTEPPSEGEQREDGELDAPKTPEEEEAEDAKLPFHEHPRWKQVMEQRNEARQQLETLTAEVETMKESAGRYENIMGYCKENNLAPQEVQEGFHMMSLLKNNPAQFAEAIKPYLQQAQAFSGEVLPEDLAREVEAGFITLDRAQETARLRAMSQFNQDQLQRQTLQAEQEAKVQQEQRAVQAKSNAVNDWEQQWKNTDPDYAKLKPFVEREMVFLINSENPQSPEEAVALARKAVGNVKAEMRKMLPPRKPKAPIQGGSQGGTTVNKTPQSLEEAFDQGLEMARGG